MQNYVNQLRSVVERTTPELLTLSEAESARHHGPACGSHHRPPVRQGSDFAEGTGLNFRVENI